MADENDIGGKVGLDIGDFKANVAELNRQIKVIDTGFKAAAAGMDDWGSSEEGLQQRISALNQITDLQKQKVANLTEQYKIIAAEKGENSKVAQDLQVKINNETAALNKNLKELNDVTTKLNNFGKEADEAGKDIKELANSSDEATSKMSKFHGAVGNVVDSFKSIGSGVAKAAAAGIAAVGAATAASVVGIVKLGNDSAKAMNHFQVQTGYSTEKMQEFRDIANQVYTDNFGENFNDIAASMAKINQTTGLAGDKLKEATEEALLFRDGFGYDVAESIDTVNSLMANFGITSKQAYTLMVQGAQAGADKNGDMLDTFKEYAPFFKTLGLSAEEFTDTLIQGAVSGAFQIDKVGDAVKEFAIRSKDGSKTSAEGFAALGLNAEQMFSTFAKGGPEAGKAFQDIIKRLGEMKDPLAQNQAGVALFGTQFEDLGIEGIKALGDIENYANSTASTLDNINNIQYNDLGSAFEGLKRKVISGLQPITDTTTTMISNIIQGINAGDWNQVGTSISTGLNTIFGQLSANLPNLANVATTVISTLGNSFITSLPQSLPIIATAAIGLLNALVTALSTNGPMLINAGLNAIVTLVQGLLNNLPQLITSSIQIIMALVDGLTQALPTLIPVTIQAILTLVQGLLDNLPQLITAAIQIIMAIVEGLINALPQLLEQAPKIIETIVLGISNAIPQLITAAILIIQKIVEFLIGHLDLIISAAIRIVVAITVGLIQAIPTLIGTIPKLIAAIVDTFFSINWLDIGIDIVKGIAKGITGAVKFIKDAAIEAAKTALKSAKEFLGIHSPSRVMRDQVGMMISAGMAEGIEESANQVNSAMTSLNRQVVVDGSVNIDDNTKSNTGNSKQGGSSQNSTDNTDMVDGDLYVTINMDGKQAATVLIPHINTIQAKNVRKNYKGVVIA